METKTEFVPPADSAINVHDIEAMGAHGFAYQAGPARFTLIAASADGGQVTATWSRGGASGFARALTARLAIRQALATFDDLALSVDVERALLSRKTEYVWRGPITSARIVADWDMALIENVERCKPCGGYGVVNRPSCDNILCTDPDCIPVEVYCVDCGGYDLLPVDAANEAIKRVDARPENSAVLREHRELAIFATEAARLLPGDDLKRAVDAYADDLRKRDQGAAEGRCEACGEAVMFNEPHANLCPLDPDALEEAAGRVRALMDGDVKPTPEGLDLYADYLRATAASH